MKQLLYLFLSIFIFASCSNDSDPVIIEVETTPTLQSFKYYEYVQVDDAPDLMLGTNYTFDTEGNIINSRYGVENGITVTDRTFIYNENGRREKVENRSQGELLYSFNHNYNDQNRLTRVNVSFEDGDEDRPYDFEYGTNTIQVTSHYGLDVTTYTFNGDKLVRFDNTNGSLYYELFYTGNNVTSITRNYNDVVTRTYNFEYDDKVNPLHTKFVDNPFYYSVVDTELFELIYYLSANNFTTIQWNQGNNNDLYTETVQIEYNAQNLPISSISYLNSPGIENSVERKLNYSYN